MWLFIAFVVVPIIEIAVIVKVGGLLGFWPTLLLVLAAAGAGAWLLRNQGLRTVGELQRAVAEMRDPSGPIAHGALILVAGILLLTPGFLTDIAALLILLPPVRTALIRAVAARMVPIRPGRGPERRREPHRPDIVDAEYEEVKPPSGERRPSGRTPD